MATVFAIATVFVLFLAISKGVLCIGSTCIIMNTRLATLLLITLIAITLALIALADHYKRKGK